MSAWILHSAAYSPNLYPGCEYANRGPDGECIDRPFLRSGGGNGASAKKGDNGSRSNAPPQAAINLRSDRRTNSWPRSTARCRLRRPMSWRGVTAWSGSRRRNFPLIGATIGLFRITDSRPVETSSAANSPPTGAA